MENINNDFEYNIQSFQNMNKSRSLKMTSLNKSYIINIVLIINQLQNKRRG